MNDRQHLDRAVALSRAGMLAGEGGPFGAVVVRDGTVIGEGWNRVVGSSDPTAHAEVVAIRDAARRTGHFALEGATVYASCEPCPMCWAAIAWARCSGVVYANTAGDAAGIGFDDADLWRQMATPVAERELVATHLPSDDALAVFAEWRDDPDRTQY